MKKIISYMIAVVMLMTVFCVPASATVESEVNASYNAENYEITINGTFPDDHGRLTVLISRYAEGVIEEYDDLTELNIGTNVVQMTTWNGSGSLTLPVPYSIPVGYYIVFCGGRGISGVPSDIFYITDLTEQNAALSAFKNATSETIGDAIETYSIEKPVVNLATDDDVYVENTAVVNEIFLNCIADEKSRLASMSPAREITLAEISECFDRALAIERFNKAENKAAVLSTYSDDLNLPATGDAATYQTAAADYILLQSDATVVSETERKIMSYSAFTKAFNKSVAICVVNSSTRDTVRENLKEYEDIIGIDVDEGYRTAKSSALNAAMSFGTFTTTELIKSAFETAVSENPKGSGGGTGGGTLEDDGDDRVEQDVVERPVTSPETSQIPVIPVGTFTDISSYSWAHDAIKHLSTKGVLQGVGGGKFEPARNIKREEYAKIMVEAFGLSNSGETKAFSDVDQNSWYYEYVNTAYANGLISGIDDQNFGSGSFVTREQAATIIYRYLLSTGYEFKTDGEDFDDFDNCSEYAKEAIRALKNSGLINGSGGNCFSPKDPLNRAQAAVMVYNIINAKEAK